MTISRTRTILAAVMIFVSMGYELPDWLTEEDIQTIIDNDYFYEENENETP